MFKDDYKQQYDNIHPSQELIERTRKIALEQYQKSLEEDTAADTTEEMEELEIEEQYETEECYDVEDEKIIPFVSRKNIIRAVGGIAAGVAIVFSGFYFGNTLKQEENHISNVADTKATPEAVSELQSTPLTVEGQEEERTSKEEKKKEKKEEKLEKSEPSQLQKLAAMSRSGGVKLDYASSSTVVFHGNFGIIVYNLAGNSISAIIPEEEYVVSAAEDTVQVSADGSKICWYSLASSNSSNARIYDRNTGMIASVENEEWTEAVFTGVQSIAGTSADVYKRNCSGGTMVSLGDGRVCQLMYQAPSSNLQASLTISIVDPDNRTETLHAVFGSTGKNLVKNENKSYGGYYNENGEKLFVNKEEPKEAEETAEPTPKITEKPEEKITEQTTPEVIVTEPPETENVEEEE